MQYKCHKINNICFGSLQKTWSSTTSFPRTRSYLNPQNIPHYESISSVQLVVFIPEYIQTTSRGSCRLKTTRYRCHRESAGECRNLRLRCHWHRLPLLTDKRIVYCHPLARTATDILLLAMLFPGSVWSPIACRHIMPWQLLWQ